MASTNGEKARAVRTHAAGESSGVADNFMVLLFLMKKYKDQRMKIMSTRYAWAIDNHLNFDLEDLTIVLVEMLLLLMMMMMMMMMMHDDTYHIIYHLCRLGELNF